MKSGPICALRVPVRGWFRKDVPRSPRWRYGDGSLRFPPIGCSVLRIVLSEGTVPVRSALSVVQAPSMFRYRAISPRPGLQSHLIARIDRPRTSAIQFLSVSPRIDDFQSKIGKVADIARDEDQAVMRGSRREEAVDSGNRTICRRHQSPPAICHWRIDR